MKRLLLALRVARWTLEVVRLAICAAQGAIDAVVTALDGRPTE